MKLAKLIKFALTPPIVAISVALAAALGARAATTADYVQDGLVAMWDGYENAGPGKHKADQTEWVDVVGGRVLTLAAGESFDDFEVTLVPGEHCTEEALFDKPGDITIEVNGRPVSPTSGTQMLLAAIPNFAVLAWDGRNGGISIMRVDNAGATANHYISYNSGYTSASAIAQSGVSRTYSALIGINSSAVYVNGQSRTTSNGVNWTGNPRSSNFRVVVGNGKSGEVIRNIRIYNRKLTVQEVAANYAVDVERFDVHANELEVTGSPKEVPGVTPAYGLTVGLKPAQTFVCTAPASVDLDGGCIATCTGYALYTNALGTVDGWLPWTEGSTTTFTYTHPEYSRAKLVWQWELKAPLGVETPMFAVSGSGLGAVSAQVTGIGMTATSATLTFAYGTTEDCSDGTIEVPVTGMGEWGATIPDFRRGQAYYVKVTLANTIDSPVTSDVARLILPKVPDGYTPVEYIDATGNQTVRSFYDATVDTKVVMDFIPKSLSAHMVIFGTSVTSGKFVFGARAGYSTTFWYSVDKTCIPDVKVGTEYVAEVGQGNVTVTAKVSQKSFCTTVNKYTGVVNLFGDSSGGGRMQLRLYGLRVYEGSQLARDCILCKNEKNIAGLYDLVSNTFYTNNWFGSGWKQLVAGPEVIQPDVLDITTTFGRDTGTTPACGRLTGLANGATVECSAPQTFEDPLGSYAGCTCTGYRLYDCVISPETGKMGFTEVPGSPFTGTSFTYTHGTTMRRLVWQYTGTYLGTNVFVGVSGRRWDDPSNWSKGAVPDATDHVVIEGKDVYLAPTDAAMTVRSLTLKKGARLEVQAPAAADPRTFVTVYPSAYKFNVTETFTIERGATFKPVTDILTGNPVFVNCTDFVLKDGGQVDATGAGYGWYSKTGVDLADLKAKGHVFVTVVDAYTYSIGAGENPNGGTSGYGTAGSRGKAYGYQYAPWLAGSPSGANEYINMSPQKYARGGGAVVIFTSGKQTVAGDIWAEGGSANFGGGSGGGIWLVGNDFEVYSTARLCADGRGGNSYISGIGLGGRISLGAGLTADQISNLVTGQVPAKVSLACGDNLDFLNAHVYQGFGTTPALFISKSRYEKGTRTYTVNTNVNTLVSVKGIGAYGATKIGGLVSVDPTATTSLSVERLKSSTDSLSHYSASGWRLLDGQTEIASGTGSTATWTPTEKHALLTLEWTIDSITRDPDLAFFANVPAGANAPKEFTGADGGNWEEPDNWAPAGVPGLSDTVTLASKTVYAASPIGAKSLVVAADAKLIIGGTGDDVLAETAAEGERFGLKVVENCTIAGQVALGGKDLTAPARMAVGGDLTLEGEAVLAVYATRARNHDFATLYEDATPVTVGGKLALNGTAQIIPDADYETGAPVHFTAGSVEIAEGAVFNAVGRGWGWTAKRYDGYPPEMCAYGVSLGGTNYVSYAPGVGRGVGAGYGGYGDRSSSSALAGFRYGYQYAPFLPGSGGSAVSPRGAGAIWIDCGGQFTLNGTLDASGESAAANSSGGGIWVSAMGFAAGPQAKLLANGGSTSGAGYGAAGGRIALLLGTTAADRAALARGETPAELTYTAAIAGVPTVTVAGGAGSYSSGTTPYMAADGTIATVRGTVVVPTVHVTGDPVEAASVGVAYGDLSTSIGATVSFSASEYGTDPNASYIRYVCTGYLATNATGKVIARGTGRSATFEVEDADTYFTWLWGGRQTGAEVVLPAGCGGSVSFDGVTYDENFMVWAGDGAEIEAVPASGYEFLYWLGDVPAGSERNVCLTLPGGVRRSVMPVFRPAAAATTCTWLGGTGDWTDPEMWDGGVIPGLGDTAVIAAGICYASNYVACANLTVNGTGKLLVGCKLINDKTTVVSAYPTMSVGGCGTGFTFDRFALDVSGTLMIGNTAQVAVGADGQIPYPQVLARNVSIAGSGILYLTASPRTDISTAFTGYDEGRGFLTVGNNLTVADTAQLYLMSDSYSGGSMVCTVANRFTLAEGAKVNANAGGFWANTAKSPQALQPSQQSAGAATHGASHGGIGNGGKADYVYDYLYAPRMPGATTLPIFQNLSSIQAGGGVIRIHAHSASIAGTLTATPTRDWQYCAAAGGSIWVTTEGNMKIAPGAVLTVKGGTTFYGDPAKGGGGGRIALARYLTPTELAALTADGDTLPAGRFADRPAKRVLDDVVAFTNRLYQGVTVNISGAPAQGVKGMGTFRFLDGKTAGLSVVIR